MSMRFLKSTLFSTGHYYGVLLSLAFAAAMFFISIDDATAAEVTLSLSNANTSQLSGFRIYYKIGSSSSGYKGTGIDQGSSPVNIPLDSINDPSNCDINLTGLQGGTEYFFVATVYDANGNESHFSNQVAFTPAVTSPTNYEISSSSNGNGTISPTGTTAVAEGESPTFTITADEFYHIDDVVVDGQSIGAVSSYTFADVASNHTISASFAADVFTITAISGGNGSITPAGDLNVQGGSSVTVDIVPDTNYQVADVLVDGTSVGAVSWYTFSNVSANHVVSAYFSEKSNAGSGGDDEPSIEKIWMEAEDGNFSSPMVAAGDDNASDGGYVWVPDGTGGYLDGPSTDGGVVEFTIEVPVAGDYVIWGRVGADCGSSDSFFVSIDGGDAMAWHIKQTEQGAWAWDVVTQRAFNDVRDASNPNVYHLEAGVHSIVFSQREDGTRLDKILVTNDKQYVPDGTGEQTEPVVHEIWQEAENGFIGEPMVAATDDIASGGGYVWVPDGSGSFLDSPSAAGGMVEFTIEVPASGDYVIWGRVGADSNASDSFFVSIDGGDNMVWHTQQTEQGAWVWDVLTERNYNDVRDTLNPVVYHLEAGVHSVVFSQREDGTRLDKILVTDDLQNIPAP